MISTAHISNTILSSDYPLLSTTRWKDFAKFTQKKKKKRTPPEDDESPSAPKVSTPPPTPPPPAPAPKPRVRKLGIFSKRNANARETDLNALISSDAKAPQFATLLSQILTFGAPGRLGGC